MVFRVPTVERTCQTAKRAVFASYNIHKCVGSDRRFDPGRMAAVIAEIGADVIAIQEADKRFGDRAGLLDLAAIERDAGLVPVRVANGHGGHGWHGNLVLVREGLVRGLRQIRLPGLEPRGAIVVDLDLAMGRSGWSRPTSGCCGRRGSSRSRPCSSRPASRRSGRWC